MLCPVVEPPSRDALLNGTPIQRHTLLAEAYMNQTNALTQCNLRIRAIREWKSQMLQHLGDEPHTLIDAYEVDDLIFLREE